LQTVLAADAEPLTRTGEVGPVEEVEIGLLKFGEADKAVDRAEAGAEVERTGFFSSTITSRSLRPGTNVSCGAMSTLEK